MTVFRPMFSMIPRKALMNMVKFKRRSSMRQYLKNKPINWGFKFWYHCASKTGYLYQFDLYLGKKESREENLGPNVVLALTECLKDTQCTIFFDNLFNSPSLIIKLFDKGLYGIGTARMDKKGMLKMKPEKQMKRGDHEYQFTDKVACCKWFDRRSVTILSSSISSMQSTSIVQRRMKGSATKIPVLCPDVIKMYKSRYGWHQLGRLLI